MKKTLSCLILALAAFSFAGCSKNEKSSADKPVKIGIAKIVQHVALDDVEKGVMDVVRESGINAVFDLQNANADPNTAAQIAAQYKAKKVDIAVGIATPIAVSLASTLKNTPVVFGTVTDPVKAGLVDTLEHGKKNVTGMSDAIPTVEHIKLFTQLAGIKTLGYVYCSNEANSVSSIELVEQGCKEAGINLVTQAVTTSFEVKQACESIVNRVDGIYLTTDNTVFSAIASLVEVFGKAKKPVFSGDVTAAKEGGIFMASGFNYYKAGRATGEMVVQILKGANPAEMPVKFMTETSDSDLLIDLDAAKKCGIKLPKDLVESANMIFQNGKLLIK